MRKIIFIATLFVFFVIKEGIIHAEPMSFEEYQTSATYFCDNTEAEWNKTSRVVWVLTYPELRAENVNTWMEDMITQEKTPLGKQYLEAALDPGYIWEFDGYKAIEVAQRVYHARMDSLFDCAVIESRIGIIEWLKKAQALKWQSEIINKLTKELTILSTQQKQCLPNEQEVVNTSTVPAVISRGVTMRMVNTATLQYCHYRKYLSYLDSNINQNIAGTLDEETRIGEVAEPTTPENSEKMAAELISRQLQMREEISKADRSLPRAILAYQEMQRTYAAHLLLVIVYDDYVRLRDNLHRYMSPVSQLFKKAFNAQRQ